MRAGYEKQLKRGILEMVVLSLICRKDYYGYELIKKLSETENGLFSVKEGTLYPILYRLEDEGLIRSRWGSADAFELPSRENGVPKKRYFATARGQVAFLEMQKTWNLFSGAVNRIVQNSGDESL